MVDLNGDVPKAIADVALAGQPYSMAELCAITKNLTARKKLYEIDPKVRLMPLV